MGAKNTKNTIIITISIALSVIISGYFISKIATNYTYANRYVRVKGLAEREVRANLAIWPVQIGLSGNNLKDLESKLAEQQQIVYQFLQEKGFKKQEISQGVFNIKDLSLDMYRSTPYKDRYISTANLTVRTKNIDKLKKLVSEISQLFEKGVLISSQREWKPIEYLYTNLNDIKPQMIEEATKNGKEVAIKFANHSSSKVGKIRSATQGIFSIGNINEYTTDVKIIRVVSTIDYFLED